MSGCQIGVDEAPEEDISAELEELTLPEGTSWITLNGRLSLLIEPLDPHLAPLTLYQLKRLPSPFRVSLKPQLNSTGVVSVAADPVSELSPVEAQVFARELPQLVEGSAGGTESLTISSDEGEPAGEPAGEPEEELSATSQQRSVGLLGSIADLDPFSADLFLLSWPAERASAPEPSTWAEGLVWSPASYELWLSPRGLPPFSLIMSAQERLRPQLPHLNTLHTHTLRLFIDPLSQRPLSGGVALVTQAHQQLSAPTELNAEGELTLSWWTEGLSDAPLTFTIYPSASLKLPTLRFSVERSEAPELFLPGQSERLDPVVAPQLSQGGVWRVTLDGDDMSLWVAHLSQRWPQRPLERDPLQPASTDLTPLTQPRLRAAGLWESQALLTPGEVTELWRYEREALLTFQPPVDHPARTTRIELQSLEGDLRVAPVLKQRLLGQVQTREGAPLSDVSLYAQQRSWPWPDTPNLRLGERWGELSERGTLDLPLDPGQHAIRLTPREGDYAPKVILGEVREVGDVTLEAERLTLSEGEPLIFEVLDQEGRPLQARVSLFCELPPPPTPTLSASALSDEFQAALSDLQLTPAPSPSRLLLSRGALNERGRWQTRLDSSSCP